ncbi:MAG TPA: CpsD/CapB family tyrosine-protein kinase [Bacillota bacterium]|nr:CpsD/CapB family tyrosine-protein kinase [Bacillota bacterium]
MNMSRDRKERPAVLVDQAPFHVGEAYNSLRTNIQFLSADKKVKKLVITSSNPMEGKTTVTVNLAISMARAGQKVLALDADLRKPRLAKLFKVPMAPGLTNILIEDMDPSKVIIKSKTYGVDIIPAGPIPPNPSELLGSAKMKALLERLDNQYDYILMDTPPAILMTDAAVLGQNADGVILVVAYKKSTYEMVDDTVSNLRNAGANLVGTVLTDVDMSKMGKGYSYKYRYREYYEKES